MLANHCYLAHHAHVLHAQRLESEGMLFASPQHKVCADLIPTLLTNLIMPCSMPV